MELANADALRLDVKRYVAVATAIRNTTFPFNLTLPMSLEAIHAAIPHRAPMLLVDEIVSQEEDSIVCRKSFRAEEYFFQGHYPDQPIVPGVILCEATVQSGAILLSSKMKEQSGVPVLTRMSDVKFKNMVRPGDEIEMSVKIDEIVSSAYYLIGVAKVNGKVAARLSFTCTVAEAG